MKTIHLNIVRSLIVSLTMFICTFAMSQVATAPVAKGKSSRLSRDSKVPTSRHLLRRGLYVGKELSVIATAYHPGEGGPITATGHKVRFGVIAVDPSVIPLYTRVYVEGYGEAIALDTGGLIKGHHIDLAYPSNSGVRAWGKRRVKIRILGYSGRS